MLPIFLIFSVFLLLRGHDLPGGGFTGGLTASTGIVLYMLAYGPSAVRRAIKLDLKSVIGSGLSVAILASMLGVFLGKPFFKAIWVEIPVGDTKLKLGTPLLFDVGVYMVVVGVVLTIMLAREES